MINKVAVIGSGVMGVGIAAHMANAGLAVVLLDTVAPGERTTKVSRLIYQALNSNPSPFMHNRCARRITHGNLEDDLHLLADCDWVVEAIVEDLATKQSLYSLLDAVMKPQAIISSNTSALCIDNDFKGVRVVDDMLFLFVRNRYKLTPQAPNRHLLNYSIN